MTAYDITSPGGLSMTVLNYGATVQSLWVPDREGRLRDVALGYETAGEYETMDAFLGAVVGRVANRIGGSRFRLNGKIWKLPPNEGENQLHGGDGGFHQRIWDARIEPEGVCFSRVSPDGEEGYPGTLNVSVRYLVRGSTLTVRYEAETDADTPVNLTNHTYFNLKGSDSAADHTVRVSAERYTESGPGLIPTGRLLPVAGTAYDFRAPRRISDGAPEHGYDLNYCLSSADAAELSCGESGIRLRVETDMPGMQLYTSGWLTPRAGKRGETIGPGSGVCLETQYYPDAVNHEEFPSPVLRAGERKQWETSFRFDTF